MKAIINERIRDNLNDSESFWNGYFKYISLQVFFFCLNEHLNMVLGNFYNYIIPVYFKTLYFLEAENNSIPFGVHFQNNSS